MAIPLIKAGIAARAIASKLATRTVGGIVGTGAKTVNPIYRNIGTNSVKVISRIEQGMPEGKQIYQSSKFGLVTQKRHNQKSDMFTRKTKTGKIAKEKAEYYEEGQKRWQNNIRPGIFKKKPTIKINSGNTKVK